MKAYSKAAKRRSRARKRRITMPGAAPVTPLPGQGARTDLDPHPDKTGIDARHRQTGLPIEQCRHQMAGCEVGRRLLVDSPIDRDDLWGAVKHARSVYAAYARAIAAPARHPASARILSPVIAMHADAESPPPDLRSEDERDRAAKAAMDALSGWLAHTDAAARQSFERHVVEERDLPFTDWPGILMALRCIVDGHKGRRVRRMKRTA